MQGGQEEECIIRLAYEQAAIVQDIEPSARSQTNYRLEDHGGNELIDLNAELLLSPSAHWPDEEHPRRKGVHRGNLGETSAGGHLPCC